MSECIQLMHVTTSFVTIDNQFTVVPLDIHRGTNKATETKAMPIKAVNMEYFTVQICLYVYVHVVHDRN